MDKKLGPVTDAFCTSEEKARLTAHELLIRKFFKGEGFRFVSVDFGLVSFLEVKDIEVVASLVEITGVTSLEVYSFINSVAMLGSG